MNYKTILALALTTTATAVGGYESNGSTASTPQTAGSPPQTFRTATTTGATTAVTRQTVAPAVANHGFVRTGLGSGTGTTGGNTAKSGMSRFTGATGRHGIPSSLSPLLAKAEDLGAAGLNQSLEIVVGLKLRNQAALESYLADVSNPQSPNYQKFLSPEEFNATYAPTAEQEQQVADWLTANGFQVGERAANHLMVAATGDHAAAMQAFAVSIHRVKYQGQEKYATVQEPEYPDGIAELVTGVVGLDNMVEMKPKAVAKAAVTTAPNSALGSNCCLFAPQDLKTFYDDTEALTDSSQRPVDGTGQVVAIAGAYAWKTSDVNAFISQWGLPALNAVQVCIGAASSAGCQFSTSNSVEASLDVEYLHGVAPGASIINYMAASTSLVSFTIMYNQIATNGVASATHVVTTSWGSCEAQTPQSLQTLNDAIFQSGNAIGQTWLAASGDGGAYACGSGTALSVDHPANSPHVIGVGGTSAYCSTGMTASDPTCGGYGSETAWSDSGGGVSTVFARPSAQTGCGIASATGAYRMVPDVSLASDPSNYGYYVAFNGSWYQVGGTSAATPEWAGYFAQLNQYKAPASGSGGLGLPLARMYQLCGGNAYHDITSGNNQYYSAGTLYDQATGIGTIDADNFLTGF